MPNPEWTRRKFHLRRELLNLVQQKFGCKDCGYNENSAALEWDHVMGEGNITVPQLYLSSWKRIVRELLKCDVRCANCHKIRHYGVESNAV